MRQENERTMTRSPCLGFVTGNPQVGYFNTVPVTWEPAPKAVVGIHCTRSPQVSLWCDNNPLRV